MTGDAGTPPPAAPPRGAGVSVVLVSWNSRGLLLDLLAALRREPLTRALEVIVVDNASSDGSAEAAARAAWRAVTVLPQRDNLGFAAGANRGIALATHPLVLLLNLDVRFEPGALEALCAWAEARPEAAIVGPRITDAEGRPQVSCWREPTLWETACHASGLARLPGIPRPETYGRSGPDTPCPVDAVSGCVLLARRAVLDELDGLDEGYFLYFEETDLCRRARAAGHRVVFAPVATFVHTRGGSSAPVRAAAFREMRRSRLRYAHRHQGTLAAHATRGLLALASLLRLPPLAAASPLPGRLGAEARERLRLHAGTFLWLLTAPGPVPPSPLGFRGPGGLGALPSRGAGVELPRRWSAADDTAAR